MTLLTQQKTLHKKKDKVKHQGQYINQDGTVSDPLNV